MPARSTKKPEREPLPMPAGRIPPQNIDAEVSTLGALLLDPEAMLKVIDILSPEDFYRPDYGAIYAAMITLSEKRSPIDIITVSDELARVKKLEEVGGKTALSSLVSSVATASNVQHYAQIVREKAMLRRLINAAGTIGELGFQEDQPSSTILDEAEKTLFAVTQRFLRQNFVPVKSILTESFERLNALSHQDGSVRGLSTGYKHVDGILGGLQRSDLIILAARPSMGKCVTADTQIFDPITGQLPTIQELVEKKTATVASLESDWQFRKTQPSHFIDNGKKPVAKVTTALGKEIETTYVHPFLTITGWKRLEELKVGDRVAVPKRLPFFGALAWPEHKIKALAYFLTDGALTRSNPTFTNINNAIIADFKEAIHHFGPVAIRLDDSRGKRASSFVVSVRKNRVRDSRLLWSVLFNSYYKTYPEPVRLALKTAGIPAGNLWNWSQGVSQPSQEHFSKLQSILADIPAPSWFARHNPVKAFLEEVGVWNKTAHQKTIPAPVFSLSKQGLSLFLNRLFACDGTAYVAGDSFPVIAYSSVSRSLIKQVQHLLLRFGIVAKIRTRQIAYRGSRRTSYELEIHGRENLLTFAEEIGMLGKEGAMERVRIAALSKQDGYTKDTLPVEIWERILAQKGKRSLASVAKKLGLPASHNFHVGKRAPRRETVLRFARVLGDEELAQIAQADVYWDRITAIEDQGQKQVYDLTVPESHNFVANDMVIHNTAFALDIAKNVAVGQKKTVGLFSLEMSKEQLVDRLISSIGLIDSYKLRTGKLNDTDYSNLNEAYGLLAEANLFIDDTASANIMEIRAKSRRLQAEHGLDLIVIDYLQLMEGTSRYTDNRVQEVSEISRSLKALAREINCPVIALSQLSRNVESRPDKRPMLSDLRESGSIEQDADVVIFLYRDDYYNKEETNNLLEVMVRKHRNGPTGDATLLARLQYGRFETLTNQKFSPE